MIRKLKIKFIALAMAAVCVLLTAVVAGMNIANYNAVVSEADSTLAILSQNRGSFPEGKNEPWGRLPMPVSPELPYESRYFSVLHDASGKVVLTDTGKIASVDPAAAEQYAQRVLQSGREKGFEGEFRYLQSQENGYTRTIFLDCGRKLQSFRTFLNASVAMSVAGIVAVFFVVLFVSGRIIAPIAESYEKQKRFITDAGHELKTPLTIINANVDVLEMELGEGSESLEDIRHQTKRLTALTNDLVMLSRMEEENSMPMIEFPISDAVAETVELFYTLAQSQDKQILCTIQKGLSRKGNDKAIRQLVSILMDNAFKYSPSGSIVEVVFAVQPGKNHIVFMVRNDTLYELPAQGLNRVFDRFYRTDASRSSETGGYGIGLSMAKAIVTAHGGKIHASASGKKCFQIIATLPI